MIKIEELIHAYTSQFCDFNEHLILTNHFHYNWETDLLVINQSGFSHEIEIKFSKNDFNNDFKKCFVHPQTGEKCLKHDKITSGDYICNHFSFLLPMGMIDHSKIPEHCGIIEFYHNVDSWKTEFYTIRKPKTIHNDSYWKMVDKDQFMRILARNLLLKKFQLKGQTEELIFKNSYFEENKKKSRP